MIEVNSNIKIVEETKSGSINQKINIKIDEDSPDNANIRNKKSLRDMAKSMDIGIAEAKAKY